MRHRVLDRVEVANKAAVHSDKVTLGVRHFEWSCANAIMAMSDEDAGVRSRDADTDAYEQERQAQAEKLGDMHTKHIAYASASMVETAHARLSVLYIRRNMINRPRTIAFNKVRTYTLQLNIYTLGKKGGAVNRQLRHSTRTF